MTSLTDSALVEATDFLVLTAVGDTPSAAVPMGILSSSSLAFQNSSSSSSYTVGLVVYSPMHDSMIERTSMLEISSSSGGATPSWISLSRLD